MEIKYPHTIENCVGEKIIFKGVEKAPEGDKVIVEAFCKPGSGPIMHTHWKQDEGATVISGRLGYEIPGQEPQFAEPGETVVFKRGTPHRFWAEGNEVLHIKGYIYPANTVVYYLSAIFAAQNKSGSGRPEIFDGAYLMTRYKSEYDLVEMPSFVKKAVIPATYFLGKILGKYKHFNDATSPIK